MIQEANASGITLSESQVCEVVSKKYFFGYITSLFGKHMACQCYQRAQGVLMFRRGVDLGDWFGWVIGRGSVLRVKWDSQENLEHIRNSVAFLIHGCGCKTGCRTARCKCVKAGRLCGPGRACNKGVECQNKSTSEGKHTNSPTCM